MAEKTIFEEVDYPGEILDFIGSNDDVQIDISLLKKIKETDERKLLKITKIIGSSPIKIIKVDDYDEQFLKNNF